VDGSTLAINIIILLGLLLNNIMELPHQWASLQKYLEIFFYIKYDEDLAKVNKVQRSLFKASLYTKKNVNYKNSEYFL